MASAAPTPSESPRSDFGPLMVRIPEGYFQMGSEIGQDNERPVHKVWVDAFDLAACQVTNADYAQFLEAAEHPKPLALGRSEITIIPNSRSWPPPGSTPPPTAPGSRASPAAIIASQAKPNGSAPLAAESKDKLIRGATSRPNRYSIIICAGFTALIRWAIFAESLRAITKCARTSTSGASIGTTQNIIPNRPERNPRGPAEGSRRSSRGGSWRHYIKVSRCAARSSIPPGFQYADYGFRVARDANDSSK